MLWKIECYNEKVKESIKEWPKYLLAKFAWISNAIENFGPNDVGMPHIKSLKQGLFEIRVKSHEGIGRAFFCTVKGKIVVILSGIY